jgi:hypothetical protein
VLEEAREAGETAGEVVVDGQTWSYRRDITETGVDDVLRIEISVMNPETGQRVAQATSMRRSK